ncbi:transposase [Desulfonema magnum]|uniref:Transposase DDE domain-containing protein n=1 Tax=Desulfonema magnum TaxID=45655 RepID=A0A975BQ27_9BACT|nr:transposase [Desulfonema magnum]QTA84175.1 Transposase family protein, IS4-like [Desulfonema magnum]QTA85505.1 Transposase family protein, IS4-like [Desulfonema magnum]QTA85697.1 Transposase family protein, IS4-like [Desulfonema magnum]QTA87722.1 Transposase IS4 domain-containing protein [Desulfonema magnum]QTA87935.1 Transposase family protein, IS4-like [Desulfonema magnum]
MSDNVNRYREIRKALDNMYPKQPKGNEARRLNTLAAIISGITGSGSCQLPKIAGKVPDENAAPASVEKRIKRWISNDSIESETFFLPFAQALLISLGLSEIVLAMDGSTVGRGCVTLMISVIYKKRALPLAYTVVRGKKGHFPEESHVGLVGEVANVIPESAQKVIFLGDGEFDGVGLQKNLAERGWLYVCRTAYNTKIFWDGEEHRLNVLGVFTVPDSYRYIRNVLFTNKKYGPVTVVVWWAKGNKEPIYLVTNMRSPWEACQYYSKRFRIETFFSDQKSRGFNIHKSHISDPDRLRRLMIGACLAYIWIVFLGTLATEQGWDRIIHRADRCDLSLFQLGLSLLEYFLNYDIPVPVAFQMFNPTL